MAYSGIFRPKHPEKYVGNHKNIIYRSTWECRVMSWLDSRDDIVAWSSEELTIPYISPVDGHHHRYFPDFVVRMKTQSGTLQTMVLEVKPANQSKPPKQQKRVTKKYLNEVMTWGVNRAKWKAAIEFCKDRNWKFVVMASDDGIKYTTLTENDLFRH